MNVNVNDDHRVPVSNGSLNCDKTCGNTALHLACQQGHNQSCRNLLLCGAKPDIKNNYGDTPLHTAARYGHAGVVRILISAFCNVNAVNKNGDTALHISSAMGRRKLTRILLESGCNPAIKNKQGETAMDIALRKNFKEVQEIIASTTVKDPPQVKRSKHKSGSSQGSRHSREKRHKSKSSTQHHHHDHKTPCHSPYGCPLLPDSKNFPSPRIHSLPAEPLRKGEQYYIDLAGNIRKGPVGKVYNCYCIPLIEKVEKKLKANKKELKEEIENCRTNLNDKISNLERKTHFQLINLNETVKSRLSTEKIQCIERNQRSNLQQKLNYERSQLQQVEQLQNQMKYWLESRLNQPIPNPRKYQPNPTRHRNNYLDGLIGRRENHQQGSNNSCNVNSSVTNGQSTIEDGVNGSHDRPKSCLSYSKDLIPICTSTCRGGGPIRSKSETHLSVAPGETIGMYDPTQPSCSGYGRSKNRVCIGTTQAEVYYDGAHSCSEDSEGADEDTINLSHANCNSDKTNDKVNQRAVENINNGDCCGQSTAGDIKNIYDLPVNSQQRRLTAVKGEIDQPIKVDSSQGQCTNKPPRPLPACQSTSSHCPSEDAPVDHLVDLMKSLRCNVVPRVNHNSPFSDSGFRSKCSPSPRESNLTDGANIYLEPKSIREHNITNANGHHPPIGLQPPPIRQLNDRPPLRREAIPTRLNMATPASSLV